ncbi:MAG: rRNA maturation RNase YbeY [Syntrophomonadaceae bacterium]|nr:rRNA maturation RNase YbeY [Syntrophomonadaceae bacterium]
MEAVILNRQDKIKYTAGLQEVVTGVVEAVADMEKLPANTELSIVFADNNFIQELNLSYRGENKPTDVLSFAMNEMTDGEPEFDFPDDVNMLGDIIISLEQARAQSEEYGHSLEREVGYLVAHGMLHLLGYNHETSEEKQKMRRREEQIMLEVKLGR